MEIPLELHVAVFLKEFKQIVTQGRGLDIVDRKKNLHSLSMLGLTKKNCKNEILSLSVSNYSSGPKPDRDKPGKVWEFGKKIKEKEIYIKLKIADIGLIKIAKCISFHEAKHPLDYPLT